MIAYITTAEIVHNNFSCVHYKFSSSEGLFGSCRFQAREVRLATPLPPSPSCLARSAAACGTGVPKE